MDQKWHVIYYESKDGECPIENFITSRRISNRAKILSLFALLEEKGPNLPRPYADFLEDGIHELRLKLSGDQIRILYFFCFRNYVILTHAFHKTSNKVPLAEIRKAKKYRDEFLARFDENKIKEALDENI
jgi:hypothetical protein